MAENGMWPKVASRHSGHPKNQADELGLKTGDGWTTAKLLLDVYEHFLPSEDTGLGRRPVTAEFC
jgi:hypothetical protein